MSTPQAMESDTASRPASGSAEKHVSAESVPAERRDSSRPASTAYPTDSMITVPLSDGDASKSLSQDLDASTLAQEEAVTGHQRQDSVESEYSRGSVELDSDYEEAVIEEASVVTQATGGSVYTAPAIESRDKPARPASPEVSLPRETLAELTEVPLGDENDPVPADIGVAVTTAAPPAQSRSSGSGIPEEAEEVTVPEQNRYSMAKPDISVHTDLASSRPSSVDILQGDIPTKKGARNSIDLRSHGLDRASTFEVEETLDMIEEKEEVEEVHQPKSSPSSSLGSAGNSPVDWDRLDRTEEQEQRDADDDSDEQTALLLARLEQENQAIATDPKVAQTKQRDRKLTAARPPSIYDIKNLVHKSHRQSVHVSRAPSPPPMTELDFWAALVQDYPATAQRLPILTSNKIRGGIPLPLRGVVWVSMAGARDKALEEQYDRLCGEQSPYENMISKDIGRSFPGVEMFRDPEGEGQRMLGRVLKCFSLYDSKIGYCQGLGFLVGPLLMQMGEREAFCVLVRLMEDYDLRSCFQPDLSGLHLRIYQFQELLHQHLPELATHLDEMQVEAAYLSQWFLSFFAVTCPLPMLFRIYDVIFAEGASETIMRVALSVMRRNEKKILALTEFEDIIQLLLGRALWDVYGLHMGSGDELVNDFVSFTSLVTRENLRDLDASFRIAQSAESGPRVWIFPEVQNAATRFLGRLWAPSSPASTTKPATLSPVTATPASATSGRSSSFLRRSASGQSLASTHKSVEGSSDSTTSSSATTLTDATSLSRVTSNDYATSVKSGKTQIASLDATMKGGAAGSQDQQIEDLLMALSEMQKEHAHLAAQLAKEREEREEDCSIVRNLLDGLNKEKRTSKRMSDGLQSRRRTAPASKQPTAAGAQVEEQQDDGDAHHVASKRLSNLIASAEYRFPLTPGHHRRSATIETKSQLRQALAQARDHIAAESTRAAELSRQLEEKEQEAASAREQLREARSKAQNEFSERQKVEKSLVDLRQAHRSVNGSAVQSQRQTMIIGSSNDTGAGAILEGFARNRSNSGSSSKTVGLREFKLGRAQTAATPQQFSKRSSSLATQAVLGSLASSGSGSPSARSSAFVEPAQMQQQQQQQQDHDREALLLELVNAKTAEAVARQELEEMRGKFESMRKLLGQPSPSSNTTSPSTTPGVTGHKASPSEGFLSIMGSARDAFTNVVSRENVTSPKERESTVTVTPAAVDTASPTVEDMKDKPKASNAQTSWGWGWGKRSVS